MSISDHQQWLVDFYRQRNWYQYSPFVHLNFLTEEVGEVSRAIRAEEIGRADLLTASEQKLTQRFKQK